MIEYPSDLAFTPSVKALQRAHGSRKSYARLEQGQGWQSQVTERLEDFLSKLDMFYFATANLSGQPYVQYRGGAPGFLKVIDEQTLGFADFSGNRQYISVGNLSENPKAFIFLMDYAQRRRIKIWGRASVTDQDPELLERLQDKSYPGRVERAIVFRIEAWDVNCPQHIHRRFSEEAVNAKIQALQTRVQELEERLMRAKLGLEKS